MSHLNLKQGDFLTALVNLQTFWKTDELHDLPAIPAPMPLSVANTEVMNLRASNAVRLGEKGVINAQSR